MARIGQIGLGALGLHFARRLLASHCDSLVVHDREARKVAAAKRFGAVPARSPKDLAARAAIVVLSLPDPAAVRDVMTGARGVLAGAAPGTLVIDTSTVDPATSREMHRTARLRRVHYIDAPVTSGEKGAAGVAAAKSGTFTVLVGGARGPVRRAMPILRVFGRRIHHLGPAGAGTTMKLISNHIAGIATFAVAEGAVLAAAAGFPVERALDVLADTVAQSYVMEDDVRSRVVARDFTPGFSVDLYHKDLRLAAALGQALGVPLPFNQLSMEMFQMMRAQGRGQRSHVDMVNFMAELARVDLHRARRRGR